MDAKLNREKREKRERAATQEPRPRQIVYDEFQPASIEWLDEPSSRILRIDIPGFKREEVKVQVDSSGKLTVRGKGKVTESRFRLLEQEFDVPKDIVVEKISGKLEGGRLTLAMPKSKGAATEQEKGLAPPLPYEGEVGKAANAIADGKILEGCVEEEEEGYGYGELLKEKISGNRKVILVAAVAFTVGFCVSRVVFRR